MATDDDETAAALDALRALPGARLADEAAEREAAERGNAPESQAAQAALALAILDEQRPWSIADRRAVGLPRTADAGDWCTAVERRLGELDPAAVVEQWLVMVEQDPRPRGRAMDAAVSAALARLPSLAPFLARLEHVLRGASRGPRGVVLDAMARRAAQVEPGMLALVRRILADPEVRREIAEDAVWLAGTFARRAPEAAALLAARARMDRTRRSGEAIANVPSDQRTTVSSASLADAVERSGCPALAATALLELERPYDRAPWARALLAIGGDAATRYLARMRARPGWSALVGPPPELPVDPLDGLTSPLADVRRATLASLARAPRAEHLQAFLLGAELDRYATHAIYRMSWQPLTPIPWLPLLRAHAGTTRPSDALLEHLAPAAPLLLEQIGVMRADQLLAQLLDANAARGEIPVPQTLTPGLRELAEQGVEAFAARLVTPPLSEAELADLEAEEAELAGSGC